MRERMMSVKGWAIGIAIGLTVVGVRAADIMVSWESNGVLVATGMEPGTTGTVEWASSLGNGFTNNPSPFAGLVADSNGVGQVHIPMFFRVSGTPVTPEGMVTIPGGTNSGTDPDFGAYSLTVEAFYMDQYEVTKAQWDTVYNWAITNDYSFEHAGSGKAVDHPVHTVNWYDCVKWCNARSEMEGKTPCYNLSTWACDFDANGYRLPTSDEWEYAARGGLSGKRFPWGDTITHSLANYYSKSSYSYDISSTRKYHPSYDVGDSPYTSPVGSFSSNGYGLYDVSGNVKEWCNTTSTYYRVVRGGSYGLNASFARCADEHLGNPQSEVNIALGFRSVCR